MKCLNVLHFPGNRIYFSWQWLMWLQYFPIYTMLLTVSKSFRHSFHPYYFLFMFSSMFLQHYVNIFVGYFVTSMLKDLLDQQKKKKEYFKYLLSIFSLKFTYFPCVYRCQNLYFWSIYNNIKNIFDIRLNDFENLLHTW